MSSTPNVPAVIQPVPTVAIHGTSIFDDTARFDHLQRVAKMFAASELIPAHLRGKLPDVCIAIAMAQELGENPLVVMQNIFVVSGRAGWSTQYMIARANKAGTFRGGYYVEAKMNGHGCDYVTTRHDAIYWDYSIGFRCCANPP